MEISRGFNNTTAQQCRCVHHEKGIDQPRTSWDSADPIQVSVGKDTRAGWCAQAGICVLSFQPCLTGDWFRISALSYQGLVQDSIAFQTLSPSPHVTLDANLTLCFIEETQRKRKALACSPGCSSHLLRTLGPLATATAPALCSSNCTQMFAEFSYLGRKQSLATLSLLLSNIQCQTARNIPFCLFCLPRSLCYPPVAIWLRISILS